jgi:aerobic carbon-monoxide dehydrogenase medium subunit
MRRFTLLEPRSVDEASDMLLADDEARPIAGGTALLVMMKLGVYIPTTLVNLLKIDGLRDVSFDGDGLRIGALASVHDVERDPLVRQHYPILTSACHVVANIRIRNLATIGGNLAHADYQSDPPAVLLALDASVELSGPGGTRQLMLEEFIRGSYETAIEAGEILTAILVPPPPGNAVGRYQKFTTRSSEDRPSAGVAVLASLSDGLCDDVRVVVGAVSPVPIRVREAEQQARGQPPSSELIAAMASAAALAVDPIEDLRGAEDYKRRLTEVLTRRLLTECLEGAAL